MLRKAALSAVILAASFAPAAGRDSLGIYGKWGAFRDPAVPRCYAIAKAEPTARQRTYQPFAAIGSWPRRGARGQVYLRLSRALGPAPRAVLVIAGQQLALTGAGADAWSPDQRTDAAILAAMRSAAGMTVRARDERGRVFFDTYDLTGAPTALDAATLGCARLR